jgi:hypothetical protein
MSTALRIAHGIFGRVALLDMDWSLVRHAHPHCHVLLKVEGADTQFVVGDRIAPLTDNTAVLVNGWQPHSYVHNPERPAAHRAFSTSRPARYRRISATSP